MATRAIDEDLELLQVLDLQGVDVLGRSVVRIVGKFFPGTSLVRLPSEPEPQDED